MAHVLLIEPNPILATTYRQALQHAGHTVAYALTAQRAIQEADARTPDVVVLELQLPVHGGVEFLHEFRSYYEWQHIPAILHTFTTLSSSAPVQEAMATDLGVCKVLYKPQTSLQQLIRAVQSAVGTAS